MVKTTTETRWDCLHCDCLHGSLQKTYVNVCMVVTGVTAIKVDYRKRNSVVNSKKTGCECLHGELLEDQV